MYPHNPGHKTSGTSERAAESVSGRSNALRLQCLDHLRKRGALGSTADECATALNESVLSIRPRFSELVALKLIRETKLTSMNASGRQATIYVLESLYGTGAA